MNRPPLSFTTIVLACALLSPMAPSLAADPTAPSMGAIERSQARRAGELLEQAVEHYRKQGPEKSFAAFNDTKGPFVNGAYYVFAVGLDGYMHANGGSPLGLAGKSTIDLRDAAGKPLIRDLLDQAKTSPSGRIEYHWRNPASNRVESKVSSYQLVGQHILAVGYYTPRASVEEAQDLLNKAVAYLRKQGADAAFAAFNNPQGGFMHDDQYVFVIGVDDGRYRATGAAPQLTGMDVRAMRDAAGKPLVEEMMALVKKQSKGSVDYVWRNPATNAVEPKRSLIERVDNLILGVGYYPR